MVHDGQPAITEMQDQGENKAMGQGATATKVLTPAEEEAARIEADNKRAEAAAVDARARRDKMLARFKQPASADIVVVPADESVKKITVGNFEVQCNKPTRLERSDIRRVLVYASRMGKRFQVIELPDSWKGWK